MMSACALFYQNRPIIFCLNIRAFLEYGDVVFANAAQNDVNKLDIIHKNRGGWH